MKLTNDAKARKECVTRVIQWLHDVWSLIEEGRPVQPDPFYERNEKLTPEIVGAIITDMEFLFVEELRKYMGYHRNAQGISASEVLVPPGFDKLEYGQQLAVVQGLDRIYCEYRAVDEHVPENVPVDPYDLA